MASYYGEDVGTPSQGRHARQSDLLHNQPPYDPYGPCRNDDYDQARAEVIRLQNLLQTALGRVVLLEGLAKKLANENVALKHLVTQLEGRGRSAEYERDSAVEMLRQVQAVRARDERVAANAHREYMTPKPEIRDDMSDRTFGSTGITPAKTDNVNDPVNFGKYFRSLIGDSDVSLFSRPMS